MSVKRSPGAARRLADRYNREAAEIDRLERRLSQLRDKHRETYRAAMDALPDGAEMEHGSGGLCIAARSGKGSAQPDASSTTACSR